MTLLCEVVARGEKTQVEVMYLFDVQLELGEDGVEEMELRSVGAFYISYH